MALTVEPGLTPLLLGFVYWVSSLSGSCGPLVSVPVVLTFEVSVLTAVGLRQAIQLPIAMVATAAKLDCGNVDLALDALLVLVGLFVLANVGLRLVG